MRRGRVRQKAQAGRGQKVAGGDSCMPSIEGPKNWRLVKRSRKVLQGAVADTRTSIGCWTRAETIYRKPWPLAAKGADGRGATSGGQLFMHAIDKKAEKSQCWSSSLTACYRAMLRTYTDTVVWDAFKSSMP